MNVIRMIAAPSITNQRELARYVAVGTIASIAMALSVDIVNQLVFFAGWAAATRSWLITVCLSGGITVLMLSFIGRANLALHRAKCEYEVLSRTDPLTGLPNRRALLDDAEVDAAALLALVIFDVDYFKKVNDTFGHRAGDVVLKIIAQTLASALQPFGAVGRLGGEEFALIAKQGSSGSLVSALHSVCERIAATPIVAEGQAVTVSISAGAALYAGEDLNTLYVKADRALYQAKATGRNRVCVSADLAAQLGMQEDASDAMLVNADRIGSNWVNRARTGRAWRN
jgi:diguanylate cyclase (GGDEF)-like protein